VTESLSSSKEEEEEKKIGSSNRKWKKIRKKDFPILHKEIFSSTIGGDEGI
jgi:stalled ribosome alternative rescue factor ArfA